MIKIDGKRHKTISDAARYLKVSTKTVNSWITKGVITPPPKERYGLGLVQVFTDEYLQKAQKEIRDYKSKR